MLPAFFAHMEFLHPVMPHHTRLA